VHLLKDGNVREGSGQFPPMGQPGQYRSFLVAQAALVRRQFGGSHPDRTANLRRTSPAHGSETPQLPHPISLEDLAFQRESLRTPQPMSKQKDTRAFIGKNNIEILVRPGATWNQTDASADVASFNSHRLLVGKNPST
jgi:hypothetical protein